MIAALTSRSRRAKVLLGGQWTASSVAGSLRRGEKTRCRIVAATNADLERLVKKGLFRSDLFFRLRHLVIDIPPLRERQEDIIPLATYFLAEGRTVLPVLTSDLQDALLNHDWPGNVRELRSTVERMRLMSSDKLSYGLDDLDVKLLAADDNTSEQYQSSLMAEDGFGEFGQSIADLEIQGEPHLERGSMPSAGGAARPPVSDVERFLTEGPSPLRRLERLRTLFHAHKKLTRAEVIQILGTSPATATRDLKTLCNEGLIRKIEPSRAPRTHYFMLQ